jgi:hypothetical protein
MKETTRWQISITIWLIVACAAAISCAWIMRPHEPYRPRFQGFIANDGHVSSMDTATGKFHDLYGEEYQETK